MRTPSPAAGTEGAHTDAVAAAEARYPGITLPVSAWHANEIIKRLDRLIELAEARPTAGRVEMEFIPEVQATVRAALPAGGTLVLPAVAGADPAIATKLDRLVELLERLVAKECA